jgi:hypothetical protein
LLAPAWTPNWRTIHCRLSEIYFSMYLQLPSSYGAVFSIRNPRTRRAVVIGTQLYRL